MTTLVHVSPMVYADLGIVLLRVDTSGDPPPGGVVSLARREVGSSISDPIIVPAGYLDTSGDVQLVNTSALLADTTVPLDTPVEYLSGLPGTTLTVTAGPVTVASGSKWRLGDPLQPYLDLTLLKTRGSSATACPTSTQAIIVSGLGEDSLDMQSELVQLPGSRTPLPGIQPISSPTFEVRFGTRTQADREAAEALFASGNILLLRAPSTYQMDPRFVAVQSARISRVRADHRVQWRMVTAQMRVVAQPPGAAYGFLGARWADLCATYATWTDLNAAGLSWASLGTGVAGGTFPTAMRTWAEVASGFATWNDVAAGGRTWDQLLAGA